MIIELYFSNAEHPYLYDAYVDRHGNLYGMNPQPPELHDMMQIVMESHGRNPSQDQVDCLKFLLKVNGGGEVHLFRKKQVKVFPLLPTD
jgi:hypothetical protein